MDRIGTLGWRLPDERILNAGAVAAEFLVGVLSPEIARAALAPLAHESILFEEWDSKLVFADLH